MNWRTDGLPEAWTSALVTVCAPEERPTVFAAYHDGETWRGLSSTAHGPMDDLVTAWMPMPKPYDGEPPPAALPPGRSLGELGAACHAALTFVENMRIVPGGVRDRLRRQLRRALGKELP